MTVETDVYDALTGDGTISGQVGTRVYPAISPPAVTYPLIVYSTISAVPNGSNGCVRTRIQLDVYAATYAVVKTIRGGVQALADATKNWTYVEGPDDYEDEEEVFRQVIDLIIQHEV